VAVRRDYYEVLGVGRQASADELKRAFRKIAMDSHPDRNPDDPAAAARFKEASEAYAVLSDPGRRRSYDMFATRRRTWAAGRPSISPTCHSLICSRRFSAAGLVDARGARPIAATISGTT